MKFAICFLILPLLATGQSRYNWKRAIWPATCSAVSGASWGFHETLWHHYGQFERVFPGANPNYWNPQESWRNKYKNGDPEQGEAFPGSTTVFVAATDAKHWLSTLHRVAAFGAGVTLVIGEKRPFRHYLYDAGISAAAFGLGFHGVYNGLFGRRN